MRVIPWCVVAAMLMAACQAENAGGPARTEAPAASASEVTGSATRPVPAEVEARLVDEPARRVVKFTNGFTLILQQNKTAPVAAVRVYVKAGSLTEQQHMGQGISHVLEHLVAGASSGRRKEAENTLLLQQIGNDSNAFTQEDETCYFITTTADKLPVAADLLIDCTTNSDFTRAEFEREFKVVQREIEMDEAEADRLFYQHALANRYLESPARHPVIGYKAAFQKITYEDCKAYYRQMYVPDNMVISIAGDIDLDAAEKLILGGIRDIPRKRVPVISLPAEPAVTTPRLAVARGDVKQARVDWAFPTIDLYHPDLYATDVLASVLGGSESSILVRRLRDELGLVTGIACSDPTPRYAQGQLEVTAELAAEKIPAAQQALFAALDEVVRNGVPAEAVERAKAQAAAQMVFGNQTAEQQASRNAEDFLANGSIDFTAHYVKQIQAVTPEQVQAAARRYISRDRLLTTVVLPLEGKDPFASAATQAAAAGETGVHKTVLRNGVTLLISRNAAAPLASFHLYTMGGLLAETDATNGIGAAMMEMLTRGTQTRTHAQIADFLDSTGTTLSAESGSNSYSLAVDCLKDKAPEAFALFADVALHPAFSAGELAQVKPPLEAAADTATEDWFGEAYKAVKEAYYARSPYRQLPTGRAEVIEKLTPEALRAQYQDHFLDPHKMVIAISGDIDPAQAATWAAAFEAIPAHAVTLDLATTPAAGGAPRLVPTRKQSATVMLAYPPGMNVTSGDRYAMILLQTYLGGYSSPFGSVLHDTLRGKGLVYTVQASQISGPAGGMFLISALGEPENAQAIAGNIQQIVEKVKAGDLPAAQLDLARDQAITGQRLANQTIAEKAGEQALDELLGLGYDNQEKFAGNIRAVTREQVLAAARKYLQAPVVVIVSPEASGKSTGAGK